ncbi:hypothetical protein [Sulfitobacter geojensis]|uniref:hypothetical protein n=1 Tax=Sulfitobacter geojensis TaxID=1342299 RepID=UPI00046AA0D0|nr:hypothetical protein [Sulfitobacter geojensis]NYI29317.1 hypothetical protein [Sulfitobacter geojensis]
MFDLNSSAIPGGVVVAGVFVAVVFGAGLGPLIADRTIAASGWPVICETRLREGQVSQSHGTSSAPDISCGDITDAIGNGSEALCNLGGDLLIDLMKLGTKLDPQTAIRERAANRASRIAELAPTKCACAAKTVASDRWGWGLYAATGRLMGGPDDLNADLTQALHGSACAMKLED